MDLSDMAEPCTTDSNEERYLYMLTKTPATNTAASRADKVAKDIGNLVEQFANAVNVGIKKRTESAHPALDPKPAPPATPQQGASAAPKAEKTWTPEDKNKVDAYIDEAMKQGGGDISKSFAYLRDKRQKVENYYDTNMAIAADYLRARWETQKCGPAVAGMEVEAYMKLKENGGVPKEGPGPVSPYSALEKSYMEKGVADQANTMSWIERAWWLSPPGIQVGMASPSYSCPAREGAGGYGARH
jgi:hypothetical protein